MKRFILIILVLLSSVTLKAQDEAIAKYITKNLRYDFDEFFKLTFSKRAYMFSIGILVGSNGRVKRIVYSKHLPKEVPLFLKTEIFEKSMKEEAKAFLPYKGKLLILPLFLKRQEDFRVDEYIHHNFGGFLPDIKGIGKYSEVVFLKGDVNYFFNQK